MPTKPKRPCAHHGCPKLSDGKYCAEHAVLHRSEVRSTKEKGYDSRWRKARAMFLKTQLLCAKCIEKGRFERATVVDHIVPHRGDPVLFWDESNWQPLCKSCHDTKTMTVDRYQEFKY